MCVRQLLVAWEALARWGWGSRGGRKEKTRGPPWPIGAEGGAKAGGGKDVDGDVFDDHVVDDDNSVDIDGRNGNFIYDGVDGEDEFDGDAVDDHVDDEDAVGVGVDDYDGNRLSASLAHTYGGSHRGQLHGPWRTLRRLLLVCRWEGSSSRDGAAGLAHAGGVSGLAAHCSAGGAHSSAGSVLMQDFLSHGPVGAVGEHLFLRWLTAAVKGPASACEYEHSGVGCCACVCMCVQTCVCVRVCACGRMRV